MHSFMRMKLTRTGQTISRTTGTLNSRPCKRAMTSDNEMFGEL